MAVFLIILAINTDGFYGGADNIQHFRLARGALKYPHLFLDLWGKPVLPSSQPSLPRPVMRP